MKVLCTSIFLTLFNLFGFSQYDSLPPNVIIDYAINDIGISEYDSILKKLGKDVIVQLQKSAEGKEVWPQTQVLNKSKTKYFRLVLWEGSECCQYYEVGYNSKFVLGKKLSSSFDDFISDNGIKLGIDTSYLKKVLKNIPFTRIKKGKQLVFHFSVNEMKRGADYYYISEYTFVKNHLIKFGFGTLWTIPNYSLRD